MNYDDFKKFIDLINDQSKIVDTLYALNVDLIDYADNYDKMNQLLFENIYNKDGYDLLMWWLYEGVEKIITFNDIEYDIDNIKNFYDFLELYYKD